MQQPTAQRATIQFEELRAREGGVDGCLQETAAPTSDFQQATALHELRSHAYLGGGFDLQQTVFSSGGGRRA